MPLSRPARLLLRLALPAVLLTTAFLTVPVVRAQRGTYDPALYSGLSWRFVGPFRAGRVDGVSGVEGRPNEFYFGSVGGGVWKTTNAGRTWTPVFDSQPIASIGAIGVSASNPDVVYVGSGEADMRSQISFGNGMYKSTDAGATWAHIGLDDTRQIGRVLVDPKNPDVVFVAALGHAYGANPDRGVFRTRDGGATWEKVLFKSDEIGAIDLAFDPRTPRTIYATLWNTRRPPWSIYPPSYGAGGGVFKSTDGGNTWKALTSGLPTEGLGRIGVAVAPSNPQRVYAIVDAKEGGLYRSEDAGATWTRVSSDTRIWGRGWYFCQVTVDPKNPDVVYVPNTALYRSTDGGRTWGAPIKGAPGGDDYRQLWIAPDDSNRMILASDQGAVVSVDGATTWSSWYNQPTAQIYHVAPDYAFPYNLTGAQQDSGAIGGPVRGPRSTIWAEEWRGLCAGGESGYTAPDPLHPEILFGGTVTRCNVMTGETKNVSPERNLPEPARHTWTVPLVFSHADPHKLYFANQFMFRTTNAGETWDRISPDLTREDPGVPPNLDAVTAADAPATTRRGVIYTIAPSSLSAEVIWAGTDDGLIQHTTDDGANWTDVTPPAMTSWSKVAMMEASHFDVNEAYAAVDRHRLEDNAPYIYRTRDAGRTWEPIVTGLPRDVYVQTVKEDPTRRGLLFAGTELAVFVSFDDGDHWQSLQLNLPPTSMRDLAVHRGDLIVATHGRGFWVLDDISVLRQITDEVAGATMHLFRPAAAVEMPPGSDSGTPLPQDEASASNPAYGAAINYYLKTAASGPVTIEILNPAGAVVRRYSSADPVPTIDPNTLNVAASWRPTPAGLSAAAGMHRWMWDFREVVPGAGGRGGRGGRGGGGGFGRGGSLALPGTYTVRLTVDGRTETAPLVVRPDPRGR